MDCIEARVRSAAYENMGLLWVATCVAAAACAAAAAAAIFIMTDAVRTCADGGDTTDGTIGLKEVEVSKGR